MRRAVVAMAVPHVLLLSGRLTDVSTFQADPLDDLGALLAKLVEVGGSDLHIKAGSKPKVRVNGDLYAVDESAPTTGEGAEKLVQAMVPEHLVETFKNTGDADFAYSGASLGRFRVNVFRQRGTAGLVMRHVAYGVASIDDLDLPEVVRRLASEKRGLVLVTGPTGSGKSTTLAAMVDHVNRTRSCNVITIEDPIEFLHKDRKASINQREIGLDAKSFGSAMRAAMRQDPDVILVGEMRDAETVGAALQAAETGHLVLSTLHSSDAAETLNRIIDFFPAEHHKQARASLSSALKGTLAQRLIPAAEGGRVSAIEALVTTGRVEQIIQGKEANVSLKEIMEEGRFYGMQTFEQALCDLVERKLVTVEDAMASATSPHDLRVRLERRGVTDHNGQQQPDVLSQLAAVQGSA